MNPILRQQSPEASLDLPPTPDVPLVSEYTHPYGLNYTKIEAVSLVTGLAGTGSDPPPSPQRAALLDEMNRRNVDESERSAGLAEYFARAGPRLLAAGHSEGRSLRRRSPRTHAQRNHEPPRRLAVAVTAHRNGRARRTNSPGQRARQRRRAVLVDPTADPKKDPALVDPRPRARRRRGPQVALAGPGDRPASISRSG